MVWNQFCDFIELDQDRVSPTRRTLLRLIDSYLELKTYYEKIEKIQHLPWIDGDSARVGYNNDSNNKLMILK